MGIQIIFTIQYVPLDGVHFLNLNIEFIEEEPIKTKVSINADVKISLKYSMLSPIISRFYKGIITGLIYKMTNSILRNDVTK